MRTTAVAAGEPRDASSATAPTTPAPVTTRDSDAGRSDERQRRAGPTAYASGKGGATLSLHGGATPGARPSLID